MIIMIINTLQDFVDFITIIIIQVITMIFTPTYIGMIRIRIITERVSISAIISGILRGDGVFIIVPVGIILPIIVRITVILRGMGIITAIIAGTIGIIPIITITIITIRTRLRTVRTVLVRVKGAVLCYRKGTNVHCG